jgi:hypothetical protein
MKLEFETVIASQRVGAKRRPMINSAKQSSGRARTFLDCIVASLLAMTRKRSILLVAFETDSKAAAADELPAAGDVAYGPSAIDSSTHRIKQIVLWMDVLDSPRNPVCLRRLHSATR